MDKSAFGNKLRKMRTERGMTKRFVSQKTGISYSGICQFEYGLKYPNDQNKIKLAKFFGTTVGKLFFDEENHET